MIQMLTADTAKFLNKGYAADEQGFYKRILEHKKGKRSPAIKQIELDLARTLPTNALFRNGEPTLDALRRVLVAFSWLNPRIGFRDLGLIFGPQPHTPQPRFPSPASAPSLASPPSPAAPARRRARWYLPAAVPAGICVPRSRADRKWLC